MSTGAPIDLLIEPFAGGATVSIALLEAGLAKEIALGDKDDLVAALWSTVFSRHARDLADMVATAPLTLAEWDRLRCTEPVGELGRAYKCVFLNRTSFSGILNTRAGPIGGRRQVGAYPIGCRFNRERLAARIVELSALRDRVRFARCQGYRRTVGQVLSRSKARRAAEGIFWYFDPPFFEKAEWLYRHSFDARGHVEFRKLLEAGLPGHWVLSYDDVPRARAAYEWHPGFRLVNLSYNARVAAAGRPLSTEVVVSNIGAVDLRTLDAEGAHLSGVGAWPGGVPDRDASGKELVRL